MKAYVARRHGYSARNRGRVEVMVVESSLRDGVPSHESHLLTHHVHHSPDGFEWGYLGSGPAELARSILWDHLGAEPHPACYQAFKEFFVGPAPRDGFSVSAPEIDQWLAWWRDVAAPPGVAATLEPTP